MKNKKFSLSDLFAMDKSSPRNLPPNALLGGRGSSGLLAFLDTRMRENDAIGRYRGARRLWIVLGAAALAGGCAVGTTPRLEIASYDFGPLAASAAKAVLSRPLLVYEVGAPAWMDTTAVYYRLAYRDAARPQAYANSRWVMPPAALLTARLRQRLSAVSSAGVVVPADAVRTDAALRIELYECTQICEAAGSSRALVRVRATLSLGRAGIVQRAFGAEKAAPPDAQGGVRALAVAGDEVIEQLLAWLAAPLKG